MAVLSGLVLAFAGVTFVRGGPFNSKNRMFQYQYSAELITGFFAVQIYQYFEYTKRSLNGMLKPFKTKIRFEIFYFLSQEPKISMTNYSDTEL